MGHPSLSVKPSSSGASISPTIPAIIGAQPAEVERVQQPKGGAHIAGAVRALTTMQEFLEVEGLQAKAFGWPPNEVTPAATLSVIQSTGGIVLGYYVADKMVGFCSALVARNRETGSIHLHLDMIGVDPETQSRSIGGEIMQALGNQARAEGFSKISWTYDPMETKNANLYIKKVGAEVVAYKADAYGESEGALAKGLPTHRFYVVWNLNEPKRVPQHSGDSVCALQSVGGRPVHIGAEGMPALLDQVRVQLPLDFQRMKVISAQDAGAWHSAVWAISTRLINAGFQITGFRVTDQESVGEYIFERRGSHP